MNLKKQSSKLCRAEADVLTTKTASTTAKNFEEDINAFVSKPSAEGFEAAKKSWLAAREPYAKQKLSVLPEPVFDDEDGPEVRLKCML